MDEATAKQLREPFPAELVGKLPRIWCAACRDARGKVCEQHRKVKCADCGNKITDAHLHLDYIGHADVTDRLLAVDPSWTWEPVAFGTDGLPLLDRNGGLWLRLTVAGVTRYGYGHADGKTGPDAVKEAIGDGLRNAAMRFGVALDLWRKEPPPSDEAPSRRANGPAVSVSLDGYDATDPAKIKRRMFALFARAGVSNKREDRIQFCRVATGRESINSSDDLTAAEVAMVIKALEAGATEDKRETPRDGVTVRDLMP